MSSPTNERGGSASIRIWFGYIAGTILWIAGGTILLEESPPTARMIARTSIMWFVAAMLNLIAVRTALSSSRRDSKQ
jgi:predicted membrane channel-forming protein YqfA (hemolysin III family)